MKEKRKLLIGIFFGAVIAWALNFFCMPYLATDFAFLKGFIAAVVLSALVVLFAMAWRKRGKGKDQTGKEPQGTPKVSLLNWVGITVFVVLAGVVSNYFLIKQQQLFADHEAAEQLKFQQQLDLNESVRNNSMVVLLGNMLDQVDRELVDNPTRTLSRPTISRIAALSYSFKPYAVLEEDGLSTEKYSPERAQLLLALSFMELDSASFAQIKAKTTFAGADLREANLAGLDLTGVDLTGANLYKANLKATRLIDAEMQESNLWGANLKQVDLSRANLKGSSLQWAEMDDVVMEGANLNGCNLLSANLRNAKAKGAELQWTKLDGAFFKNSDLTDVNLTGASFNRTDLTGADMTRANMNWALMSNAIWERANLTDVKILKGTVESIEWYTKLMDWQVTGAEVLMGKYELVEDPAPEFNYRVENNTKP